jgi:hypothetical protein
MRPCSTVLVQDMVAEDCNTLNGITGLCGSYSVQITNKSFRISSVARDMERDGMKVVNGYETTNYCTWKSRLVTLIVTLSQNTPSLN